ncbi:MAG: DUF4258 domain-containing protein [Halothece sp.]
MEYEQLIFSSHAVKQMFARKINKTQVKTVLATGEVIKEYSDDYPYPSYLFLGFVDSRPIHVVVGFDAITKRAFVITTYQPDSQLWESDYKRRKKK